MVYKTLSIMALEPPLKLGVGALLAQVPALQIVLGWTFPPLRTPHMPSPSARTWARVIERLVLAGVSPGSKAMPANDVRALSCALLPAVEFSSQFCPAVVPNTHSLQTTLVSAAACPNSCSGHGRCVSLAQMSIEQNAIPVGAAVPTKYGGLEVR